MVMRAFGAWVGVIGLWVLGGGPVAFAPACPGVADNPRPGWLEWADDGIPQPG